MRPTELAESALSMRNIAVNTDDLWTTFEVIENGELGMRVFSVKEHFLALIHFVNKVFPRRPI